MHPACASVAEGAIVGFLALRPTTSTHCKCKVSKGVNICRSPVRGLTTLTHKPMPRSPRSNTRTRRSRAYKAYVRRSVSAAAKPTVKTLMNRRYSWNAGHLSGCIYLVQKTTKCGVGRTATWILCQYIVSDTCLWKLTDSDRTPKDSTIPGIWPRIGMYRFRKKRSEGHVSLPVQYRSTSRGIVRMKS